MGQLRFIVPRPERVDDFALQRAYVAGLDCIPWVSCADWENGELIVEREIRESGNLFIPWQVAGWGEFVLSTASLMERKQPYLLAVELARGTLNRCRNYFSNWQQAGLQPSPQFLAKLHDATTLFTIAATNQAEPLIANDDAERAIVLAVDAIHLLVEDFVRQVLANRKSQPAQHTTLLAGQLETTPLSARHEQEFLKAFNTAAVSFSWRDLEPEEGKFCWEPLDRQLQWCRENGLKIIGGPILRLDPNSIPDWLYLWVGDFEMVQSQFARFAEAVVQRYKGKLHVWNACARVNVPDGLKLSEEERLRLTVDVIETIRRADARVPLIATFDQPWGEYLAREEMELSPLHFADTLVRSELGLSGIGLEINYGYCPDGTYPRDLLEFARLVDQWSGLGLPLVLFLTAPSSAAHDTNAKLPARPGEQTFDGGLSVNGQRNFAARLMPFLLSLQAVQGVVWNQLRDSLPHNFANGGAFDGDETAKPLLSGIAEVRSRVI